MSLASRSFGVATKLIAAVAKRVPDGKPDPLADGAGRREVGRAVPRLDGHAKVTGSIAYTADHAPAGLAHAAIVGSTIARGRIVSIDTTEASALPGVLVVMTHENAPRMKPTAALGTPAGPLAGAAMTKPILNTDQIFWNGQPVAVVVAESPQTASHAASLVRVAFERAPEANAFEAGLSRAVTPVSAGFEESDTRIGDAARALGGAAVKVDNVYTTPPTNHCAMELHVTLAWWESEALHVRDATQYPYGVKEMLAKKFGLKKTQVHVEAPFIGGGFGGKAAAWPHVALAVAAAKLAGRPVRLPLTRAQTFTMTGGRAATRNRLALGADGAGRLVAMVHECASTVSSDALPEAGVNASRNLYACPNVTLALKVVRLDRIQNAFMRAPGEAPGSFALESAMDELAWAAGLDPIDLRLRNEPDINPTKGTRFTSRHLPECYAVGAEAFGWSRRVARPRAMREGHELVGFGMAAAVFPTMQFGGGVRLRLDAEGVATIESGHTEMGVGSVTAQAQATADRLGLPLNKIRFVNGSADMPPIRVPGGSATTATLAVCVASARDALVKELLVLCKGRDTPLADARPDDVDFLDESLVVRGKPQQGMTLRAILAQAGRDSVEVIGKAAISLKIAKYSMQAFGAHFCEVRVDEELGVVRISRWVGVIDAGRIVNPITARSQIIGAVTMGIGMALTEDTVYDEESGRVVNGNLGEYHLPVHADAPRIDVRFIDKPDPLTPLGLKGIGEVGIVGAAAAVANAVFHATGRRVRDLPIRIDRLL